MQINADIQPRLIPPSTRETELNPRRARIHFINIIIAGILIRTGRELSPSALSQAASGRHPVDNRVLMRLLVHSKAPFRVEIQ